MFASCATLRAGNATQHSAAGYPSLSLSVDEGNPAIGLYEKYGFREVSRSGGNVTMRAELVLDA